MGERIDWSYPTRIWSGRGRVADVADACRLSGIRSPLVVTDAGLAATSLVRGLVELLGAAGLHVGLFAEARPDPGTADVVAGVIGFRQGGHDGVVAVGGGSAIDVGKLVAFAAGQTLPLLHFVDDGEIWRRADAATIAPVIAVPTTAGTGSEVGRAAVVLDEATNGKRIVFHPAMLPTVVVCDPEVTVGLPTSLTVGTGMDAFSHCLEAYCVPVEHPMADGIAVEGMRRILEHLPTAVDTPGDLDARQQMMWAAVMGGTAFQKGLGAMHALAHPIGARHHTHHGMTNAVLMPFVLAANIGAIAERLDRLARWLDVGTSADDVLHAVVRLRELLGVPPTLADLGVPTTERDRIVHDALLDPSASGNPRPLTAELAGQIFDAAQSGRLD